jgi:hypothetical protein
MELRQFFTCVTSAEIWKIVVAVMDRKPGSTLGQVVGWMVVANVGYGR